jgi:hypothetical protein
MKNLLIGSQALQYWSATFSAKPDADWDVISEHKITDVTKRIEHHTFDQVGNYDLLNYASTHWIEIGGQRVYVVNPVGLAIVKRSHLWCDRKFEKHMTQYNMYLKVFRPFFTDKDEEVLNKRIKLTMSAYPQGNPNLMQTVEDFFDDAVTKKYNHDYLHELFAYHEEPLYKKLQKDLSLAWCDKKLWYNLSHADKLRCIAEEAYVISTERFLVPSDWKTPAKLAFYKSVNKICTTLCSGWFRDYAIDNYTEVLDMFDAAKVENVKQILLKE